MTDLTREGLVELAERCEKASGPDIKLDCAIWEGLGRVGDIDYYTASLDAAMTLIPEGRWYWAVKNYPNAQCAADIGGIYIGVGATPALALCAAALKARARAMEAGRG